jgi:hypothetical protein
MFNPVVSRSKIAKGLSRCKFMRIFSSKIME